MGKLFFKGGYAAADVPFVAFKLTFTGSSLHSDTALAGKIFTLSRKAGQHILIPCKLDLYSSFAGIGPLPENVEYEKGTVDGAYVGYLFNVALLGRGKLAVENKQIGLGVIGKIFYFLKLSGADKGGRIGTVHFLNHPSDGIGSCGFCKFA